MNDINRQGGDINLKLEMMAQEAVYFGSETDCEGEAKQLLRRVGEKCNATLYERIVSWLQVKDGSAGLLDALAEGMNKQIGPRAVLNAYLAQAGVIDVEALKNEIRALCAANTDMESNLGQKSRLLARLAEAIGPTETHQWFMDEFPHLVSQT